MMGSGRCPISTKSFLVSYFFSTRIFPDLFRGPDGRAAPPLFRRPGGGRKAVIQPLGSPGGQVLGKFGITRKGRRERQKPAVLFLQFRRLVGIWRRSKPTLIGRMPRDRGRGPLRSVKPRPDRAGVSATANAFPSTARAT